jgi:hypothetical protein
MGFKSTYFTLIRRGVYFIASLDIASKVGNTITNYKFNVYK